LIGTNDITEFQHRFVANIAGSGADEPTNGEVCAQPEVMVYEGRVSIGIRPRTAGMEVAVRSDGKSSVISRASGIIRNIRLES
jgi:hypothetical protein